MFEDWGNPYGQQYASQADARAANAQRGAAQPGSPNAQPRPDVGLAICERVCAQAEREGWLAALEERGELKRVSFRHEGARHTITGAPQRTWPAALLAACHLWEQTQRHG